MEILHTFLLSVSLCLQKYASVFTGTLGINKGDPTWHTIVGL